MRVLQAIKTFLFRTEFQTDVPKVIDRFACVFALSKKNICLAYAATLSKGKFKAVQL